MRQRCNDKNCPSYKYYGARGIKICKKWNDYKTFEEWAMNNGYTEELTLDRINVNGNYEPSNCRWATKKEQSNNRRDNILIEYNNEIKTIHQWSEKYNIGVETIKKRLKKGWNIERVFNEKPYIGKNQYSKNKNS